MKINNNNNKTKQSFRTLLLHKSIKPNKILIEPSIDYVPDFYIDN